MQHHLDRCPQGPWELAQVRPRDLHGVVRYAGYAERAGWSIANREVAGPIVPLIINFGDPFRIRMGDARPRDHRSFVAGLYDGWADVASTGRAHCMQIDFTPLGAYRFFGMPMRDLAARTVALDEAPAFGQGALDRLSGQLYEAPDWAARFALLDSFVRRRLAAARPPSSEVAWAWQTLVASGGGVRVGAIAAELGWSRRRLAARFAIEVGATPKAAGRILRFGKVRRSVDLGIRTDRCVDWAGLAAESGFADQAHLIREFRAMAGVTPVDYVRDAARRFQPLAQAR